MSRHVLEKEIRNVVIDRTDWESFTQHIESIIQGDNKGQSYKREPTYRVEYTDGQGFEANTRSEFTDFIFSGASRKKIIDELAIRYYGYNNHVNLTLNGTRFPSSSFKIETTNKPRLRDLQDELDRLVENNSSNWIIHSLGFSFLISFLFAVIAGAIAITIATQFQQSKVYFMSIFIGLLITLLLFDSILINKVYTIYPRVILQNVTKGRMLKKDLWKIAAGTITLILLPLLINFITDHL